MKCSCEYSGCWAGGCGAGMGMKGENSVLFWVFIFHRGNCFCFRVSGKKVNANGGHCGDKAREKYFMSTLPNPPVFLLVCEKCPCPWAGAWPRVPFGSKQNPGPSPVFQADHRSPASQAKSSWWRHVFPISAQGRKDS